MHVVVMRIEPHSNLQTKQVFCYTQYFLQRMLQCMWFTVVLNMWCITTIMRMIITYTAGHTRIQILCINNRIVVCHGTRYSVLMSLGTLDPR